MFSTAIDLSRNWSGTLGRFCIGAVTVWLVMSTWGMAFQDSIGSGLNSLSAISIIGLLIAALLTGNVCVLLGGVLFSDQFREPKLTYRGVRVGLTNNVVLIEFFKEATNKLHLVSGITGSIIVVSGSLIFFGIRSEFVGDPAGSFLFDFSFHIFDGFIFAVSAILVRLLFYWSATHELNAIDNALDLYYPKIVAESHMVNTP